jgi:hypothetical protein
MKFILLLIFILTGIVSNAQSGFSAVAGTEATTGVVFSATITAGGFTTTQGLQQTFYWTTAAKPEIKTGGFYPNPFTDVINNPEGKQVIVTDITGRRMYSGKERLIFADDWAKGVYIINLHKIIKR